MLRLISLLFLLQLWACGSQERQNALLTQDPTASLYVGTYTGQGSEGIYQLDFDTATGALSNQRLLVSTSNPSYLTHSADHERIYAVNEGKQGSVSAFQWNDAGDSLKLLNQLSAEGSAPCHLELHPEGNLLAVANYSTGNIVVYRIDQNGALLEDPQIFQHAGSGPVQPNQDGPRAHCVKFHPNGRFLYAVDLGIDQVKVYPVTAQGVGNETSFVEMDPGDGPRHMVFNQSGTFAFVVNELGSSVVSLQVNPENGELTRIDKQSTLPQDFQDKNYCADIHLSDDENFLYASNRGHNSIAVFRIDPKGMMQKLGVEPVRGTWPRNFTLSLMNTFILVANQNSDNITVFRRNRRTGLLDYTGHSYSLSRPVALKFFR